MAESERTLLGPSLEKVYMCVHGKLHLFISAVLSLVAALGGLVAERAAGLQTALGLSSRGTGSGA